MNYSRPAWPPEMGPMGCLETSVTTDLWCVKSQRSEDRITISFSWFYVFIWSLIMALLGRNMQLVARILYNKIQFCLTEFFSMNGNSQNTTWLCFSRHKRHFKSHMRFCAHLERCLLNIRRNGISHCCFHRAHYQATYLKTVPTGRNI
jgi:uncharacterized membrane protein (DUF4010 family)